MSFSFIPQHLTMRVTIFLVLGMLLMLSSIEEVKAYCDYNGCSIPGNLPPGYKSRFTPACNKHYVCYACVSICLSVPFLSIFHFYRKASSSPPPSPCNMLSPSPTAKNEQHNRCRPRKTPKNGRKIERNVKISLEYKLSNSLKKRLLRA